MVLTYRVAHVVVREPTDKRRHSQLWPETGLELEEAGGKEERL